MSEARSEKSHRRYDTAPPTSKAKHRAPLLGALLMGCLTVGAVSTAVLTGAKMEPLPTGEITESRKLFFRDASGGRIAIYDGETRHIIKRLEKGEGAFIRQSMRALNHSRRVSKKPMGEVFELARTSRDILLLKDPSTGEQIKLNAFGRVAMDSFRQYLPSQTSKDQKAQNGKSEAKLNKSQKGA